jgi:NAD(P)H-hydrate epimerase
MKLFKSNQISEIDKFTIENEPIASIDLMERAATVIFKEIVSEYDKSYEFCVIVGPGNNGGDGLVIARLLKSNSYNVEIYVSRFAKSISTDCNINLQRLKDIDDSVVHEIENASDLEIPENTIIIDAIFGSGLTRETGGEFKQVIDKINHSKNTVLAIDIPSGLFGEDNTENNGSIVKADITYAIEFPSISMMFPENYPYYGDIRIVSIGLSSESIIKVSSDYFVTDNNFVSSNFRKRERFDHKGNFGHLLLIAGSYGKAGASVLATKAAVKTGVGLVTAHLPVKLIEIMQISVPEAMISIDKHEEYCSGIDILSKFNAIGIGPGLDTKNVSKKLLLQVFEEAKEPVVLDADALNILAGIMDFADLLKPGTVLTPHPKEFERLFGKFENSWKKVEFMKKISIGKSIIIVLKGGITTISLPDGRIFFNTLGNPGMATGGSGDVLTGIIGSLLAQGYSSENAAIMGVYFHSIAGDFAKQKHTEMSLCASDIMDSLEDAFKYFV